MEKIVLLSIDDGTVWDKPLVELLNRYGIPATFNLNSGLEDFVWEFQGQPVRRQHLADTVEQYRGHEVASHTLTHPRLDQLPPPRLRREAEEDAEALKAIFGLEEVGFAVPFTVCGQREVNILRRYVRYIRLSEYARDFRLPEDPWHIPIHALYNDEDIYEKLEAFAAWQGRGLFVIAGHSYELELLGHWEKFEALLRRLKDMDLRFMTTMDFVREFYP